MVEEEKNVRPNLISQVNASQRKSSQVDASRRKCVVKWNASWTQVLQDLRRLASPFRQGVRLKYNDLNIQWNKKLQITFVA